MRRKLVFIAAAGLAALVLPWSARAQVRSSSTFAPDAARTATRSPPEIREERQLLRACAGSSLLATRAGALALARSASPEVRAFAAGLVRHHQAAQLELLQLLQARGLAMPMLDNTQSRVLARLEKLSGVAFDREFMAGLGPEALRRDLRSLEAAVQTVKDPALKGWAQRSLSGLREQLVVAERTERSGGANRTAAGPRGAVPAGATGPEVTRVGTRVSGSSSR